MFGTPAASTARTISSPSATFMASGFSQQDHLAGLRRRHGDLVVREVRARRCRSGRCPWPRSACASPSRRARSPRRRAKCCAFCALASQMAFSTGRCSTGKKLFKPPVGVRVRAAHEAAADQSDAEFLCHRGSSLLSVLRNQFVQAFLQAAVASQASGQKHRSMVHQSCGRRDALTSSGMSSSKFEHAEAEGRVRGGFVVARGVLVAGVVGIDQVRCD